MKKNKIIILLIISFVVGASVSFSYFNLIKQQSITVQIINDRNYASSVLQELKSARKSIHIAMFSLTYYLEYPNSDVNKFLKTLADKYDKGVDVKVVIDEFPENHEPGFNYLKERGVPIKYDGKKQTTHAKLIIIDGKKVIVGSTNWRYYSINKNHEANVLIESKKVAQEFEKYFEKIWNQNI